MKIGWISAAKLIGSVVVVVVVGPGMHASTAAAMTVLAGISGWPLRKLGGTGARRERCRAM